MMPRKRDALLSPMRRMFSRSPSSSAPPSPSPDFPAASQDRGAGSSNSDEAPRPTVKEAKAAEQHHSNGYKKMVAVSRASVVLARLAESFLDGTPFKAAMSVFVAIADAVEAVKDTDESADVLLESLAEKLLIVEDHFAQAQDPRSRVNADDFVRELVRDAEKIYQIRHASGVKKLDAKELKSRLETVVAHIDKKTANFRMQTLLELERDTKIVCDRLMKGSFERWNRAPTARYKADVALSHGYKRQACTEGTRIGVLDRIAGWATDPSSPSIFWLSGMAGSGKSTIAYTICRHFSEQSASSTTLGASFFCSRQVTELRRLGNIAPTIAYQLARHSRSFALALDRVDPDVVEVSEEHVEKLLLEPWTGSAIERPDELPLTLIVIDALDEIEDEGGVSLLEDLIAITHKLGGDRRQKLKVFVTSRPHPGIVASSAHLHPDTVYRLEDIEKEDGRQDIMRYLSDKLPGLNARRRDLLEKLTNHADGLFIYAATVVRLLSPSSSAHRLSSLEQQKRLSRLLQDVEASHSRDLKTLYNLYKQVLFDAVADDQRSSRLPILHRIICALQPLPVTALARMADIKSEDEVDEEATELFVQELHAVLYISSTDGCVYVYHKSFLDFILDNELSGTELACRVDIANEAMARASFRIMRTCLRFNICNIPSSFLLDSEVPNLVESVKANITDEPGLEYVCRYWAIHMVRVNGSRLFAIHRLHQEFLAFLNDKVFFWIEAMNLLGAKTTCLDSLRIITTWVERKTGLELAVQLMTLLNSVRRLSSSFLQTAVCLSTPHLYISCLATEFGLTPDDIGIDAWRTQFVGLPRMHFSGDGNRSGALVHIRAGAAVRSVAFSFDATRIVSSSSDFSVCIWEALTGVKIQELKGHTAVVNSAVFLPDGTHIASGSNDMTVRIWDTSTGAEFQTLYGHSSWVNSVATSPDGRYIVSASNDKTVRVWDSSTGAKLQVLSGHSMRVSSVAFSFDGTHIVSGSGDKTVRIWNASTGAEMQRLQGHMHCVNSVMFSPDGKNIVSSSDDRTVRIFDVPTGREVQKLSGHTQFAQSAAFSPDGTRVVSGSADSLILVWNASTGRLLNRLGGNIGGVRSVIFSPDGTCVVSGSDDRSVRVWDTLTSTTPGMSVMRVPASTALGMSVMGAPGNHTSSVNSVAFSPNGERIVSGSSDRSVRVWDALTGAEVYTLRGHAEQVGFVAFSANGGHIVSSDSGTINIWDALRGAEVTRLGMGNTKAAAGAGPIVFSCSPDGTRIVYIRTARKTLKALNALKSVQSWSREPTRPGRKAYESIGEKEEYTMYYSNPRQLCSFGR